MKVPGFWLKVLDYFVRYLDPTTFVAVVLIKA